MRKQGTLKRRLYANRYARPLKVKRLAERCSGGIGIYEFFNPVREVPYRAVRLSTMLHGPNPDGSPSNAWGGAPLEYMLREILSSARAGMPGQIGQLF